MASLEERFWSKVWQCTHRSPCKRCCWPWKRFDFSLNTAPVWARHALFTDHELQPKHVMPAHRFAFETVRGTLTFLSQDFPLCHRCDFGPCSNPCHLTMGSKSDNLRGSHGASHRRKPVTLPDGRVWTYEEAVLTYLHNWARANGYMPEFAYRRAAKLGIALGEGWVREWERFPHWIPPWTRSATAKRHMATHGSAV